MDWWLVIAAVVVGASLFQGGSAVSGGGRMNAQVFLANLETMKGWKYSLGAGLPGEKSSPPYTDCGEFIRRGLQLSGVDGVPRNITGQVEAAPFTKNVLGWSREQLLAELKPGDCIAYKWPSGGFPGRPYDHGEVYKGNSKNIHASSSKGEVTDVSVPSSGHKTIYSWVR